MADGSVKHSEPRSGTVGKALSVLDEVAAFGRPVRFGELLDQSPYPKATLYRLLQTLTSEGMLAYDAERQTYSAGIRLVRLAHAAWAQASLAPIARPHLDILSAATGETVHLAQLDSAQVLYVDKRNAKDPLPMYSSAGKVGPAYCTGVGKAMLAFLPPHQQNAAIAQQSFHRFTEHTLASAHDLVMELNEIKQRGHAFDREEHEPGIICIAVPVKTAAQHVLGAISVTSSIRRTSISELETHLPHISETAAAIAAEAVDWRFPDDINRD
ncbi:MAG: IclR family transcriptional regulator [Pseudomonadota bacterium]